MLDLSIITTFSTSNLIVTILGLIILWVIISLPVYFAAEIVTGGRASLGEAMAATFLGAIVYIVVLVAVDLFLGAVVHEGVYVWAFILAFLAWLWVYKAVFATGWLGAIAIAILAVVVFLVINVVVGLLFGVTLPARFFPPFPFTIPG